MSPRKRTLTILESEFRGARCRERGGRALRRMNTPATLTRRGRGGQRKSSPPDVRTDLEWRRRISSASRVSIGKESFFQAGGQCRPKSQLSPDPSSDCAGPNRPRWKEITIPSHFRDRASFRFDDDEMPYRATDEGVAAGRRVVGKGAKRIKRGVGGRYEYSRPTIKGRLNSMAFERVGGVAGNGSRRSSNPCSGL